MFEFHGILPAMVPRPQILASLRRAIRRSRVVALVGPRQCGKTTLARQLLSPSATNYFDLEEPESLERLVEPMTALSTCRGLVVIDEIHRHPELFPILRVLADRRPSPARFLVLGSASPELLRQASESLAGRIETIRLAGLGIRELGERAQDKRWLRGGFPLACLARSNEDSFVWRRQFISTFLERDVPQLGVRIPPTALLRLWTMIAHYHGRIWNAAEPARLLGVSEPTVRRYLDLLTGLFMVRQLQPWHENIGKRQVKSPKVYVRDTGLLHALLGIKNQHDLLSHPKCGHSWEGFIIEEILQVMQPDEFYFWATHQKADLDLLVFQNGRRIGVEVKRIDAPRLTPSMRSASEDLHLDRLIVFYPGSKTYDLSDRVYVRPLTRLIHDDTRALLSNPRESAKPSKRKAGR